MACDTTVRDRAVDTVRQAAHVAHEAPLERSVAWEAGEVAVATVTYLALVEAERASSFVDAHVRQP